MMPVLRFFIPCIILSFSLNASSVTTTSAISDELEEIVLPTFKLRHQAFIRINNQDALYDKEKLGEAFSRLSAVYQVKARFLLDLSKKQSIFTYSWKNQEIENYLPDLWLLQKIDTTGLTYSHTPSSQSPIHTIDLKALSRRFYFVAYYYNKAALDLVQADKKEALAGMQEQLETELSDPVFTPFWAWILDCSYTKEPLPNEDDIRNQHRFAKKHALDLHSQYENLQALSEDYDVFYRELEFESLNAMLLRASSVTGHHDLSTFKAEDLKKEYGQRKIFLEDRLSCTAPASQSSPRSKDTIAIRRRMVEVNTENEVQELEALQKHSFLLAIISSDFFDMPKVYEAKLKKFNDPSKQLHREATYATLSRIAKFFQNYHFLIRNIFLERVELMLSRITLLRLKKNPVPFHNFSAFIFRQYLLADWGAYEYTLEHLLSVTHQYSLPAPSTPLSSSEHAVSSSPDLKKKPVKKSFLSSVFSKSSSSSGTTKGQHQETTMHINPLFGRSLPKAGEVVVTSSSSSSYSSVDEENTEIPLLSFSTPSQDLRQPTSPTMSPRSPRHKRGDGKKLIRFDSLRKLMGSSDSIPPLHLREPTLRDHSKDSTLTEFSQLSLRSPREQEPRQPSE